MTCVRGVEAGDDCGDALLRAALAVPDCCAALESLTQPSIEQRDRLSSCFSHMAAILKPLGTAELVGSAGKDTFLNGDAPHVEVVVVVPGYRATDHCKHLQKLRSLLRDAKGEEVSQPTQLIMRTWHGGVCVDVQVGGAQPERGPVIFADPALTEQQRRCLSSSMACAQRDLIRSQSSLVKDVVRAAKYWKRLHSRELEDCGAELTSYAIELLVLEAHRECGAAQLAAVPLPAARGVLFAQFLTVLADLSPETFICWELHFSRATAALALSQAGEAAASSGPVVVDPLNPSCNVLGAHRSAWVASKVACRVLQAHRDAHGPSTSTQRAGGSTSCCPAAQRAGALEAEVAILRTAVRSLVEGMVGSESRRWKAFLPAQDPDALTSETLVRVGRKIHFNGILQLDVFFFGKVKNGRWLPHIYITCPSPKGPVMALFGDEATVKVTASCGLGKRDQHHRRHQGEEEMREYRIRRFLPHSVALKLDQCTKFGGLYDRGEVLYDYRDFYGSDPGSSSWVLLLEQVSVELTQGHRAKSSSMDTEPILASDYCSVNINRKILQ